MTLFVLRRLAQSIIVLFVVSFVLFTLQHILPGGPARAILGPRASPAAINAFNTQYGLRNPLPVQYFAWLGQVLKGNLGFSYKLGQSVDSLLFQNLPRTLVLVGVATLLAIAIAVPAGVYQAARRGKPDEYFLTGMTFIFYSMPSFLLGLGLIVLFSDVFPIFPSTGPTAAASLFDQLPNLVLPIGTLCLTTIALFSRYVRSSVVEQMVQDYARTARATGASQACVLFVHVLRNALLPTITLVGLSLPGILSGALIVEALFNYPGLGLLFWNAAQNRDYPLELGSAMVVAVAVVVGSLLADMLYSIADPRVRSS